MVHIVAIDYIFVVHVRAAGEASSMRLIRCYFTLVLDLSNLNVLRRRLTDDVEDLREHFTLSLQLVLDS